jgi:phage-related protein
MVKDRFEIELLDEAREFLICTHGFIKKTDKVPKSEIDKARRLMKMYFETY